MGALQRFFTLKSGARMPSLGLGTYRSEECQATVDHALTIGYRHIDTALSYRTEPAIGEVLHSRVQAGKLRRDDVFITTKVPPVYLSPPDVKMSLERSLDDLRTPYVDMFLIHQPWGRRNRGDGVMKPMNERGEPEHVEHDLVAAWRVMEEAVKDGRARAIGVSNFTVAQLERIRQNARSSAPENLQLEVHAYNQQPKLLDYCRQNGIVASAYSPLGAPYKAVSNPDEGGAPGLLLEHPVVQRIAESHRVEASQILLNFLLRQGVVVLPKATMPRHLEQNMNIFDINLSVNDMHNLSSLHCGMKYFSFDYSINHPDFIQGAPF